MLSKDGVQIKTLDSGKKMARFAVAFNKSTQNERTKEYEKQAEFIAQCVAFDDTAEFAAATLAFKDTFNLSGEVELQNWTDKNGTERTSAQILVWSLSGPIYQPKNTERATRSSTSRTTRERASKSWGSGSSQWGDI
ncbi:single-stranded DNA-binding protein [Nocardia terpenica]|uniref:single-stranded DNA-binding protein n=1 Tax=Nocardia terpenica TaxID=455432 RepID=UPI00189319DD|nr:single-stranded DNA-binding protein [Nocardia terpenica]MBF6063034.1 single-stranded DNA-binding protein [Nocardia terpenica]MBF6104831.1 single-stranded DNA-binding protein [Nocardia terpenica]MBF6112733.1 single-stranded DNA-binding protein [Nocardia terpenica]MBF6118559.1 single-stranded DNA-binding protein [Nocardia terpenica]MBF6155038.1 single-stranded DNA-binding protein [Nocardia terpenica]